MCIRDSLQGAGAEPEVRAQDGPVQIARDQPDGRPPRILHVLRHRDYFTSYVGVRNARPRAWENRLKFTTAGLALSSTSSSGTSTAVTQMM